MEKIEIKRKRSFNQKQNFGLDQIDIICKQ